MKRLVPMILAMLALASPAYARRDVLRQQSAKTVDAGGLRGVRAENSHGDIRVGESRDGRVHVTALKVIRSASRAESERMARQIRVEVVEEAGELVVRARYPARRSIKIGFWDLFNDFEVPSQDVQIGLELPPGMPLAVRTSSGDIETSGVSGPQRFDTTSGDVRIEDSRGLVQISTTSGDIDCSNVMRTRIRTVSGDASLEQVRAPLDVHTTSGDLTIHGAADSLTLGTVSGDIEVEDAVRGLVVTTTNGEVVARRVRGRVEIGASSGSVDLGVVAPLTAVEISTGSGDIDLNLGRGLGARVELQTSNGTLQLDSPIQVSSLTRRRVTGQLRQGTTPVSLRSASGDIHVTTGEQGS